DDEYSPSKSGIGMSPIGLREATPATTKAVCRRWSITGATSPELRGPLYDENPCRLSGGLRNAAADGDGADLAGAPVARRRSGNPGPDHHRPGDPDRRISRQLRQHLQPDRGADRAADPVDRGDRARQ